MQIEDWHIYYTYYTRECKIAHMCFCASSMYLEPKRPAFKGSLPNMEDKWVLESNWENCKKQQKEENSV